MITGAPLFFGVLISPSAHAVPPESCNLPWLGGGSVVSRSAEPFRGGWPRSRFS